MIILPTMRPRLGGGDPYFTSVVGLWHFDGTNGSTTFTNEVTNALTLSPKTSSSTISTTQSVFGGASLRIPLNSFAESARGSPFLSQLAFGTGDFTIEFRVRPDSVTGDHEIMDLRPTAASSNFIEIYTSGTTLRMFVNTTDRITSASSTMAANTWAAVALSRVSGTSRMFVNGTQVGSNFTDSINYANGVLLLGISVFNSAPGAFYIDELRITNGVGRYAANYTIATAQFPQFMTYQIGGRDDVPDLE